MLFYLFCGGRSESGYSSSSTSLHCAPAMFHTRWTFSPLNSHRLRALGFPVLDGKRWWLGEWIWFWVAGGAARYFIGVASHADLPKHGGWTSPWWWCGLICNGLDHVVWWSGCWGCLVKMTLLLPACDVLKCSPSFAWLIDPSRCGTLPKTLLVKLVALHSRRF